MSWKAAAQKVVGADYPVAFHFDPMMHFKGCEEAYAALAQKILAAVPAERIAWFSVGSLRFQPDMRRNALEKYPRSQAMLGEFVRGFDGKMRYIRPLRHKLYDALLNALRSSGGADVFTYFCMENEETWQKFMGHVPQSNPHLDFLFADNLCRRFPGMLPQPPRREDFEELSAPTGLTA